MTSAGLLNVEKLANPHEATNIPTTFEKKTVTGKCLFGIVGSGAISMAIIEYVANIIGTCRAGLNGLFCEVHLLVRPYA